MFARISRGWQLTKTSLHVIRLDKELLLLPVMSGIATVLLFAGLVAPSFLMGGASTESPTFMAGMFAFYFASSFIVVFFNAALVSAARERLTGGDPTVRSGLAAAWARKGPILGWALLTATVGMLLRALQRQRGIGTHIAAALFGAAWAIASYFVVPVLVIEGGSPFDALRKSGATVRRAWGEALVGEISTGGALFLLGLAGVVAGIALMALVPALAFLAVPGIILWVLLIVIVGAAADAVLKMALYLYATTGTMPQAFAGSARLIPSPR